MGTAEDRGADSAPRRSSLAAVGSALRAFGEELDGAGAAQVGGAFTDVPAADAFLHSCPEAFLIGVLFTQGIPAERAWAGPYALKERLGHFELARLATEPETVQAAVAQPPALHRFIYTLPVWITAAARRLLDEYGGAAARIWPDGAHVSDVMARLRRFDGIGDKKAAMAAAILVRHFGARLEGAEYGRVAYDVHVRRVFLRTGLVAIDDPDAINAAAAAACPEAPATLDLAAWLVGRTWCRPQAPQCAACRLGESCARLAGRTAAGVGVRPSQSSARKSSPESSFG